MQVIVNHYLIRAQQKSEIDRCPCPVFHSFIPPDSENSDAAWGRPWPPSRVGTQLFHDASEYSSFDLSLPLRFDHNPIVFAFLWLSNQPRYREPGALTHER